MLNGQNAYLFYSSANWPKIYRDHPDLYVPSARRPGIYDLHSVNPITNWSISAGTAPRTMLNLDNATATVQRCAPWLQEVWLVPELFDEAGAYMGGVFVHDLRVYLAYSDRNAATMSSLLYHELFHAIQFTLKDDFRLSFGKKIRQQAAYYNDERYLDQGDEKTARLFQYFAMYLESGGKIWMPPPNSDDEITPILYQAYSGSLARESQRQDQLVIKKLARQARAARLKAAAWRFSQRVASHF